jgi:hypothetical protein
MDNRRTSNAIRRFIFVVSLCALGAPLVGRADAIQPDAASGAVIRLAETSVLVSGSHTTLDSFLVPYAGMLTISLSDLAWPNSFAVLSLALTDSHATLGRLTAPGVLNFDVSTPGQFFAFVFGQAQGPLNIGLYSLNVSLTPAVAAVPLPAAVWLLFSGIAGLSSFRRRLR